MPPAIIWHQPLTFSHLPGQPAHAHQQKLVGELRPLPEPAQDRLSVLVQILPDHPRGVSNLSFQLHPVACGTSQPSGILDRAEPLRERRRVRRPASGRIRAMEYRVYRLLETSHAT